MKGKEAYEKRLKLIVQNLPEKPGCYQYLDEQGTVIYVGKAKNLKRRVTSYFIKENQTTKTRMLVSRIADLKYIVVETEWDAFLLENNLIKRYKPRYNILLKDDKTYPSICITREDYPRVFKTRKIIRNGSDYYGPYSHMGTLNGLLQIVSQAYKIRTCRLPLTEDSIKGGKFKECLEYHIKNCPAPCIGHITRTEYNAQIAEIREILKGRSQELTRSLMQEIKQLSSQLRFEEAQAVKNKYDTIMEFREKSRVVDTGLDNVDVYNIDNDDDAVFVNYLHVAGGCINQAFTFEYKRKMDETLEEMLMLAIVEMRNRYHSTAREIIVPFMPDTEYTGVTWTVPQKGEKKKLLELSFLNVKQYRADRLKRSDKLNPEQKHVRLMKELGTLLGMEKTPLRIECFDNSHISGTDAVAACVVYENGKPCKKDYRLYNIKSGAGGDDYGSMYEVMMRRWMRAMDEGNAMPDLVIVDGGKGQMSIAKEVIDNLNININIAGLVKNAHHKTSGLLFGFPQMEVGVKPDSELFRLLEQMQEEVHRVAISFHKKKRSKRQTHSELTDIKGIGENTATSLIKKFKSVKRISEASLEELTAEIGKSKAETIYNWFHK
ncbi:MAG: excinuclease ABC subunit C [Bacteroidaceae bacterium]|nr:excinuclease ABC subunit C [Bacteroidaceae bacterium]MBO7111069.1 excinuclease ABC subunit C [Bacteroidaceae bacterium]